MAAPNLIEVKRTVPEKEFREREDGTLGVFDVERSRIEIDPERVYELAARGVTQQEAADNLGVSLTTFKNRLSENGELRHKWDQGQSHVRISLREAQLRKALGGNPQLLIWLGKQFLDQKDTSRTELTGADGGAIEISRKDEEIVEARLAEFFEAQERENRLGLSAEGHRDDEGADASPEDPLDGEDVRLESDLGEAEPDLAG